MALQYPIINGHAPGSWEDPGLTIEIPIASGDLEVAFEKQCTGPAKQVDGRIAFGPALGNDAPSSIRTPCAVSVHRIRVRRSDLEAAAPHILQQAGRDFGTSGGGRASDSGAYARGVAAARDAIAAAKYDAEHSHAEWSIREVVVPEDSGKMNRTALWLVGIVITCVAGALAVAWLFLQAMHIGLFEAIGSVLR